MDALPIFDFVKWLVLIPLFGFVFMVLIAMLVSLAEIVFTVVTRLKWRLIDYFDRKFFKE